MRAFVLLIAFLIAAHSARAQDAPDPRPTLMIDPAMHTAPVRSLDVSPDGALLATASDDKTARLWSLPGLDLLRTFRAPADRGEGGRLYAVAISPDGKLVAAAGYDADPAGAHIYLFEAGSGQIRQRIGPLGRTVIYDLAFSPDGSRLAAGFYGKGGIRVWRAPFSGEPAIDQDYSASTSSVVFRRDNHLFVAAEDGMIRHYDAELNGVARKETQWKKPIQDLALAPDGKIAAYSLAGEPGIEVIDANTLEPLHRPDLAGVTSGDVGNVAFSSDGRTLFATGTHFDANDLFPVFAWDDAGRAARRQVGNDGANFLDIASTPPEGVAGATGDPSIALLAPARAGKPRTSADMREKLGEKFLISASGETARFGFDSAGTRNVSFDAARLVFGESRERPEGFIAPETQLLPVSDWEDQPAPSLAGAPLAFENYDSSRSLAIAHAANAFVLGSNFFLSKYDKAGGLIWRVPSPSTTWGVNLSTDDALLAGAFGDGTIRWYRANDGKELLAFFVHAETRRWIAWTPSGYYAASPGAEDLIGWHVNGKSFDEAPKFYPASRFRDQFYRPDIVGLVLKLRSENDAVEQANAKSGIKAGEQSIEALLPASVALLGGALVLETDKPEVTVAYELASPTGRAVTRVEARIDEQRASTRGAAEVSEDYPAGAELQIAIQVPPRDSELSLVAFIGDQAGPAQRIPVKWTGARPEEKKPRLFALLVGVSAYADPGLKLAFAAKDAADFAETLRAQDGVLYQSVEIETLTDAAATKSAVETALARLRRKAGPDDLTVVFLAGHGVTDAAQNFYYLGADAELEDDLLDATAVSGATIRKGLARVPGRVVLFMDTCHSGDGVASRTDMSRATNELAEESAGLVMFASSQGREVSFERSDWQNGAFTEALLAIIAEAKFYGDDGKLSIPELEEAVTTKVAELTEGRQNAGMTKYGAVPRFFIAGLK